MFMSDIILKISISEQFNHLHPSLAKECSNIEGVNITIRKDNGPQASILLLATTIVVIKIAEGLFTKIGEVLAEELTKFIFPKIKENQEEPTIMTSKGIKTNANSSGYTLHHSVVMMSRNNRAIKFLFKSDWSLSQSSYAFQIILDEVRLYENDSKNQITPLTESIEPLGGMYLISVDIDTGELYPVSIIPNTR